MPDNTVSTKARRLRTPQKIRIVSGTIKDAEFALDDDWINFAKASLERVDFRKQRFDPFHSESSAFVDCNFEGVRFQAGTLGLMTRGSKESTYLRCRFDRADMRGLRIGNARFERCTFRRARISGWRADDAEFVDCVFEGLVSDVRFAGRPWLDEQGRTNRTRNEFVGNDFRAAKLDSVEFVYGIDLDRQFLPTGDENLLVDRASERFAYARSRVALWPDDKEREAALLLLRVYSENGYREQRSVFVSRQHRSIPPGVSDRLWGMVMDAPSV